MRAPGPRGAEPSVASMVTRGAGPRCSASRARMVQSAIAGPELVDRGEDALRRGGGVELWKPPSGRGGGDRLGQGREDRDREHQRGSPTAFERWIVASAFSPRSQIFMPMRAGRSPAVGIL